jgi:exopolysaccharide/PEP-CTERM locus tyrosine autokinase
LGKVFNALEKFNKEQQEKGPVIDTAAVDIESEKRPSDRSRRRHPAPVAAVPTEQKTRAGAEAFNKPAATVTRADLGPKIAQPTVRTPKWKFWRRRKDKSATPASSEPNVGRYHDRLGDIDPNLVVLQKPHSFEAEQFKILRTNLLFPASGKPPRSIMITSTHPGEGKSFVAANLALSIAQNINEYVLLIDGDMRKPSIHRQFGFGDLPGLSEHLSDNTPLASMLVKTKFDKLTILPAGTPPHNPSELLSSGKMQALLKEVTERYSDRYIIVDSPPPSLTAETSAIASYVDGIIVVIRYSRTRRQDVVELFDTIGKDKVLGTVANRLSLKIPGYGRYKKYNDYYRKTSGN